MRRWIVGGAATIAAVMGLSGPALAAANQVAPCQGVDSSWMGPSGVRDERSHNVVAFSLENDIQPGYFFSLDAHTRPCQ